MSKLRAGALAALGVLASGVLVAALPSTSAVAAFSRPIIGIDPPGAPNNLSATTLVKFTLPNEFIDTDFPYPQDPRSTRVDLIRSDPASRTDIIAGRVTECIENDAPCDGYEIWAQFGFGTVPNTGTGEQAPANPGLYDAYVYYTGGTRDDGNVCLRCFEVFQGGAIAVTSVSPTQVVSGTQSAGAAEFTVRGDNFSRDSVVEALIPGTNAVDTAIKFPPLFSGTTIQANTATVRKTSIRRRWQVETYATPGPRHIRVRSTGGDFGVLENAFVVSPIFVSVISPTAGSDRDAALQARIGGRGFPDGSIAQLVGAQTTTSVFVIEGQTVTSAPTELNVVFNLTGAPAGDYRVRVLSPDRGFTSSDDCSPTFSVASTTGARTVTPVGDSTRCAQYSSSSTPSPTPSASRTTDPSSTPTGCGPGTGVACPGSPTPTGSATGSPTGSPTRSATPTLPPTATPTGTRSGTPTTATPSPTDTRQPTRLTLGSSRPTIYSGESISLSGQLFKSDGTPVRDETVQILGKVYPASTATPVATAVTDSNGAYFVTNLRPARGADYIATYNGSNSKDLARATSNTVHVNVKTLITVTSPRSGSVLSGSRRLVVFGTTNPNKAGSVIALQMRTGTSTRKIIAIGRVASNGGFEIHRYRDTPMPVGRYTLQVTIGPATGNSAAASQEFLLFVR